MQKYHLQDIGIRIKLFRQQADLSQEKLAELINVERSFIYKLENGIKTPSVDKLIEIANALGTTVDDLIVSSLKTNMDGKHLKIDELLADCTPEEQSFLIDCTAALKKVIRK